MQQGGSTITQQYVKNVYLTSERTLAPQDQGGGRSRSSSSRSLARSEILERYLNTIYFGRGAYGVQAAAAGVLRQGRRASIGLPEAALPGRPDPLARAAPTPLRAPGGGQAPPARTVLDAMLEEGYDHRGRARQADAWPSSPFDGRESGRRRRASTSAQGRRPRPTRSAPSTSSRPCARQVAARYGEDTLYGGGLRIYTTLDLDMQRAA